MEPAILAAQELKNIFRVVQRRGAGLYMVKIAGQGECKS